MNLTLPIMIRRVQGHSMVPVLPPGTLVYAWRWYRKLKPQKVIIFTRQDRETIKRIDNIDSNGIFVLGDHTDTSTDSRHYGTIPREAVEGVVFWPRTARVLAESGRRWFQRHPTHQKDI
jgi:nickel-type superoxide dismutase maturation protease